MKWLVSLSLFTCLVSLTIPGALCGADDGPVTILGALSYLPRPDVSICFCGSFLLATEAPPKECYLVSDSIDLAAYTGQRVLVQGRSYSGLCSGTLARPCSYVNVRTIVSLTSAGVEHLDWGTVKTMYR